MGIWGGLARALGAEQQGESDEQKYIAQARRQAMLDSLTQAQIDNLKSEAANRGKPKVGEPHYDEARGVYVSPDGTVTTPKGLPAKPTTPKAPATAFTDQGLVQYNETTGEWEPAKIAGGKVLNRPAPEQGNQVIQGEHGEVYRVPLSGPAGLVPGVQGKSAAHQESATIKKAVANNRAQLSAIDEAIAGIGQHPEALGAKNYLPEQLMQRWDPAGVGTRAAVADVGSLKVHDRSGGAVSVSEYPRLAPFVPSPKDTPEAARIKLTRLRKALKEETDLLEGSDPGGDVTNEPPASIRAPKGKYSKGNPWGHTK